MEQFEIRRDRFEFFESFENPMLNLTFTQETENFLIFCKDKSYPPFHFFLYCLIKTFNKLDNFRYRFLDGKVFKIDEVFGSYTVLNQRNLFNYTRFQHDDDFSVFLQNSLKAKEEAEKSDNLINTGIELSPREMKNYIFITSIPWLDFTSIQHPVFKFKSSDIPSVAWGKFTPKENNKMTFPLSLQAHHGFVDGFHIHEFSKTLSETIKSEMQR